MDWLGYGPLYVTPCDWKIATYIMQVAQKKTYIMWVLYLLPQKEYAGVISRLSRCTGSSEGSIQYGALGNGYYEASMIGSNWL